MLRRRISKPGVVLALALACATSAHAESSLDAVRARGLIRVGVKTDAPPFGFIDARGHPVGFEVDLARFFARVLFDDEGRARLVPVTTSTRFAELQAGRVDLLLATVTATEQRRTVAELSDPYFTSGSLILVARDTRLGTLGEAAGRKVAVVKGSVQEADVAELQPRAILITVGSLAAGAHAVRSGQADAFLYDDVAVLALARRDPALRVTGAPIRPRPYVAAARKEDTGLIRWVNGWLAKMRRDGTYRGLWRRYFTPFESHLVGA